MNRFQKANGVDTVFTTEKNFGHKRILLTGACALTSCPQAKKAALVASAVKIGRVGLSKMNCLELSLRG
jgi:hypothetical protein